MSKRKTKHILICLGLTNQYLIVNKATKKYSWCELSNLHSAVNYMLAGGGSPVSTLEYEILSKRTEHKVFI